MDAAAIVEQIDALILEKVSGTLENMSQRSIGSGLSINPTATLAELRSLRTMYANIALAEDPYFGLQFIVMR